ncbi:hypothetical protein A4A49_56833, partial [Nicotiana attenuata]
LFVKSEKPLGAPKHHDLEADELEQAHIYVLKNCDEVLPFLEEFAQIHVDSTQHLSDTEWNRQFIKWFKDRVAQLYKEDDSQIMEDLLALSRGPTQYVLYYNGYIINGYRFHVEDYDKHLRTQNCGVVFVGETDEHNEHDIVSVNWGRFLKINEPFVLVDQASQLFYANDNFNKGWCVARKTQPRDSYEILQQMDGDVVELKNPIQNKRKITFWKGHMQTNIPSFSSTDDVMHYIQTNSASTLFKIYSLLESILDEGKSLDLCVPLKNLKMKSEFHQNAHYNCQSMSRPSKSTLSTAQELRTMNKNPLVHDKENMQTDISFSPSVDQVMQSNQKVETRSLGKGGRELRSMCSFEEPSKSTRLDSTMYATQGLRTMNQKLLFHDKENMHTGIPFSPSIDQVMQSTQTVETTNIGSGTAGKVKEDRGSNKCKEVASLEVGEKLKVTFYNNRIVGKNSNLFSRPLGKIVRDRDICPLGVSSWDCIKEEK